MQTQDAVAKRALALGLIAVRAQAENKIAFCEGEVDQGRKLGNDLVKWATDLGIDQWLSPAEIELHRYPVGNWPHEDIGEKFWRIESLKAVLWALQFWQNMPTYFDVGNVNDVYAKVGVRNLTDFFSLAKLRPEDELWEEHEYAAYLHWRCRTELMRLEQIIPPYGDTYEAVVARSLVDSNEVIHDGVDILIDGVRFTEVEGNRKGDIMSICYERHLALEWICFDDDWDETRADT